MPCFSISLTLEIFMFKFLGLASGLLITLAIAPHPVQAQDLDVQSQFTMQNDAASRDTETCIKLRGCGRRELTWIN